MRAQRKCEVVCEWKACKCEWAVSHVSVCVWESDVHVANDCALACVCSLLCVSSCFWVCVCACRRMLMPPHKCSLLVILCVCPVGMAAAWWQPLSTLHCLLRRPLRCPLTLTRTHTRTHECTQPQQTHSSLLFSPLLPRPPLIVLGLVTHSASTITAALLWNKDRENSPAVAAASSWLSNTLERRGAQYLRHPVSQTHSALKKNTKITLLIKHTWVLF